MRRNWSGIPPNHGPTHKPIAQVNAVYTVIVSQTEDKPRVCSSQSVVHVHVERFHRGFTTSQNLQHHVLDSIPNIFQFPHCFYVPITKEADEKLWCSPNFFQQARKYKLHRRARTAMICPETATSYAQTLSRRQQTPTSFPRSLSQRQSKLRHHASDLSLDASPTPQRRTSAVSELNGLYHRGLYTTAPISSSSFLEGHQTTKRSSRTVTPKICHFKQCFDAIPKLQHLCARPQPRLHCERTTCPQLPDNSKSSPCESVSRPAPQPNSSSSPCDFVSRPDLISQTRVEDPTQDHRLKTPQPL